MEPHPNQDELPPHGLTALRHDKAADYMRRAVQLACKSPPKPTNFCVGALLISEKGDTIVEGYTLECAGNTHAEQCCFIKLAEQHGKPPDMEELLLPFLPLNTSLYTTMEPCNERLSGNMSCVDRILKLKDRIKRVFVGVIEPDTFVGENVGAGRRKLEAAGIQVIHIKEFEKEILEIATSGHHKDDSN